MSRPEPEIIRIGDLTMVNRTGATADVGEMMEALESADYSHIDPDLNRLLDEGIGG